MFYSRSTGYRHATNATTMIPMNVKMATLLLEPINPAAIPIPNIPGGLTPIAKATAPRALPLNSGGTASTTSKGCMVAKHTSPIPATNSSVSEARYHGESAKMKDATRNSNVPAVYT